jgi:hypothetical protein
MESHHSCATTLQSQLIGLRTRRATNARSLRTGNCEGCQRRDVQQVDRPLVDDSKHGGQLERFTGNLCSGWQHAKWIATSCTAILCIRGRIALAKPCSATGQDYDLRQYTMHTFASSGVDMQCVDTGLSTVLSATSFRFRSSLYSCTPGDARS